MTKVTKKSKKAELVAAAMERKLYASEEEANKLNNKELYENIMACDRVRALAVEEANKTEPQKEEVADGNPQGAEVKAEIKVKKSLPKRNGQNEPKTEEQSVEAKAEESTSNDENLVVNDIKPFREELLSLIRKNCGTNLASVKKSGLQKSNYTKSIDFLNKSIEEAMGKFNSGKFEDDEKADGSSEKYVSVNVHIVDKKGEVQSYVVNVYVSSIMKRVVIDGMEDENVSVTPNPKEEEPKKEEPKEPMEEKSVVTVEGQDNRTDEEKETAESIMATFEALYKDNAEKEKALAKMREDYEKACEIGNNLDRELHKVQKQVRDANAVRKQMYTDIISIANQMAATKNSEMVAIWSLLDRWLDKFVPAEGDISVRFNMNNLIADAKKTEAKQQDKVNEDANYEGTNISFINGEAVCPDGVKKKVFKEYKSWYDDCEAWVDYVADELAKISKMKNKEASKKARKTLIAELKGWYSEWKDTGCDSDVVDMVEETMTGLLNHSLSNVMAMSYLTAVVDELELV